MTEDGVTVARKRRMGSKGQINRVSFCGDTGRPCSWMPICAVSYSRTDWSVDEHGNQCREIGGGCCARETFGGFTREVTA